MQIKRKDCTVSLAERNRASCLKKNITAHLKLPQSSFMLYCTWKIFCVLIKLSLNCLGRTRCTMYSMKRPCMPTWKHQKVNWSERGASRFGSSLSPRGLDGSPSLCGKWILEFVKVSSRIMSCWLTSWGSGEEEAGRCSTNIKVNLLQAKM